MELLHIDSSERELETFSRLIQTMFWSESRQTAKNSEIKRDFSD